MRSPEKILLIGHGFDVMNIVFIYLLFIGNSHQVEIAFQSVLRETFVSINDFCEAVFLFSLKIDIVIRIGYGFDRNGGIRCRIVQNVVSFRIVVVVG